MAGTTNALQWNPTAANQETDAAYLADSMRAGGAVDPSIFPSVLANKLFYQLTTYLDALFSAFAAKGFTTSDANLSTLTAQCSNFLTTADLLPAVQLVPYGASLTLNAAQANGFYIEAMTGNLTIAAVTGLTAGQMIALYYQQDATGGRTVTFPAVVTGATQPDPSPNAVSLQLFGYDSVTAKLRAMGPLVSNTGAWFAGGLTVASLATLGSLTLLAPGTGGQVLTNVGGVFVPLAPAIYNPTIHVVTGSRTVGGTPIQNTSGGLMTVAVSYSQPSSGTLTMYAGTSYGLGSTQVVAQHGGSGGTGSRFVSHVIPNLDWYSVTTDTAGTLVVWTETY